MKNTRPLGLVLFGVQIAFLAVYLVVPGTDTTTRDSFSDTLFEMMESRWKFVAGGLLSIVGDVWLAVFAIGLLSTLRQASDSSRRAGCVLLFVASMLDISAACIALAVVDGAEPALLLEARRQVSNVEWLRNLAVASNFLAISGNCALSAAVVLFGTAALRAGRYRLLRGLPGIIGGSLWFAAASLLLTGLTGMHRYYDTWAVSLAASAGGFITLIWSLGATVGFLGVDAAETAVLIWRRSRVIVLNRLTGR